MLRVVNWADHGRDILNFVISYIDTPLPTAPSAHPPILSPKQLRDPSLLNLDSYSPSSSPSPSSKKIIGIGHSLGGGGLAFAATSMPSLFAGIIFVDPVLPPLSLQPYTKRSLAYGAILRRDSWASREEAREQFLKKDFFKVWDERVLDNYIEFGMKDSPNGGINLKTRKIDEAVRSSPFLAPSNAIQN
jgi:hypothetical protein